MCAACASAEHTALGNADATECLWAGEHISFYSISASVFFGARARLTVGMCRVAIVAWLKHENVVLNMEIALSILLMWN